MLVTIERWPRSAHNLAPCRRGGPADPVPLPRHAALPCEVTKAGESRLNHNDATLLTIISSGESHHLVASVARNTKYSINQILMPHQTEAPPPPIQTDNTSPPPVAATGGSANAAQSERPADLRTLRPAPMSGRLRTYKRRLAFGRQGIVCDKTVTATSCASCMWISGMRR